MVLPSLAHAPDQGPVRQSPHGAHCSAAHHDRSKERPASRDGAIRISRPEQFYRGRLERWRRRAPRLVFESPREPERQHSDRWEAAGGEGAPSKGRERERLWEMVTAQDASYAEYQTWTARKIPVIMLEPRDRSDG